MVKMVSFKLCIFYHNFLNWGKKLKGEVQQAVDFSDLGLKKEDRTRDKYLGVFWHWSIILYLCLLCCVLVSSTIIDYKLLKGNGMNVLLSYLSHSALAHHL